jgi:hypothetical protein
VAYDVALLCQFESDPASLSDDVRSVADRFGVPIAKEQVGEGWHSIELGGPHSGAVIVEIHFKDESTRAELLDAAEHLDAALLDDVNGVVILTLSGDVDEALIYAVAHVFDSSCRAVHDEISGFVPWPGGLEQL